MDIYGFFSGFVFIWDTFYDHKCFEVVIYFLLLASFSPCFPENVTGHIKTLRFKKNSSNSEQVYTMKLLHNVKSLETTGSVFNAFLLGLFVMRILHSFSSFVSLSTGNRRSLLSV